MKKSAHDNHLDELQSCTTGGASYSLDEIDGSLLVVAVVWFCGLGVLVETAGHGLVSLSISQGNGQKGQVPAEASPSPRRIIAID